MATSNVDDFFDRIDTDAAFAARLGEASADPATVREILAGEGFDVDPEDVREAFLERFGSQLSEEQLAAIAGGLSGEARVAIGVGAPVAAAGITIGVLAAAAAF